MEGFLLQLASGVTNGAIYALLALALVMIHQATHHINFAQGEMATFSAFIAWWLMEQGVPYWPAFFLTIVAAFLIGAAIFSFVLKPFEKAGALTNVIVFIALLLIFNALSGLLFHHDTRSFPSPFTAPGWTLGGLLPGHTTGLLLVTALVVGLLFLFLRGTSLGLGMRAAALNPASARLVGVRVSLMLAIGWGLASAIGAVAGMMVAPIVFLEPHMMSGVLIYAFAAALLGGIDSPGGAAIGGFVVGITENLLGAYVIGTDLKLTMALVLIVVVLLARPNGLFGKAVVTRV